MKQRYVARPGRAVTASTRRAARRAIVAAESSNSELKAICAKLREYGIDTTVHNYEMRAKAYEGYGGGTYTLKFRCPGDYLAYVAMCILRGEIGYGMKPESTRIRTASGLAKGIDDYFGGLEDLLDACGDSIESMSNFASTNWWGDEDDYIMYLKNIDTGDVLYDNGEPDEEVFEDGDGYGEDY